MNTSPEKTKDRHVSKRCGGFSCNFCYLNNLMRPMQAMTEITTINAVVNLRACSLVAVILTLPSAVLLAVIVSIDTKEAFFREIFNSNPLKSNI
jgi:hypothetical protein